MCNQGILAAQYLAPVWVQILVAVAVAVAAAVTIWTKGWRPLAHASTNIEKFIPVANQLIDEFASAPDLLPTLADIAEQFHPDSGTTLRDVVNRLEAGQLKQAELTARLEATVAELQAAARVRTTNDEVARILAEQDRTQLAELVRLIRNVRAGVDNAANQLAASQDRADAIDGEAGAAADSASKSPPAEAP